MTVLELLCADITRCECDAVVVNLFEGVKIPGGATGAVDAACGGLISWLVGDGGFTGRKGQTALLHTLGRIKAPRVVVVGLGRCEELDYDRVRDAAGLGVRAAVKAGAKTVATIIHGAGLGGLNPERAAAQTVLGSLLANHRPVSYQTGEGEQGEGGAARLERLLLVERDGDVLAAVRTAAQEAQVLAEAQAWARDLVAEPGNRLSPAEMAGRASAMAESAGLGCEVLGPQELAALGAGAILAVGQGSCAGPRMIVLRHQGAGPDSPWLGLVGKAVTFDSGGISLKGRDGMEMMKDDMGGGAAVLGAMRAIAALKIPANVLGVVPAVENMPSGTAQRPGDVIKTMDGRTVEIISTDAEGRLILADGLAHARGLGARALVDVATLTGACVVALGNVYTGLVSTNDRLAGAVQDAAKAAGERVWRLPAHDLYREQLKSKIADVKNSGGREGGAITGGLFIGMFANDVPWAHLDIAGTCWTTKDQPDCPEGPTGVALRTLVSLAQNAGCLWS